MESKQKSTVSSKTKATKTKRHWYNRAPSLIWTSVAIPSPSPTSRTRTVSNRRAPICRRRRPRRSHSHRRKSTRSIIRNSSSNSNESMITIIPKYKNRSTSTIRINKLINCFARETADFIKFIIFYYDFFILKYGRCSC